MGLGARLGPDGGEAASPPPARLGAAAGGLAHRGGAVPGWAAEDAVGKVAVVGRPNVGKSSLLNALLGEERMVVNPVAGTTRDSVACEYEWRGEKLLLIDTAGIRRQAAKQPCAGGVKSAA